MKDSLILITVRWMLHIGLVFMQKTKNNYTLIAWVALPITCYSTNYKNQSLFRIMKIKISLIDFVEHIAYTFSMY